MADVKQYGLSGVSQDVQIGKGGPRIRFATNRLEVRNPTDTDFYELRAATPTGSSADSMVATKGYVDSLIQGLSPKESVRVATTNPATLATAFEAGDTIDGVVLVQGDRVLIKDQAAPAENGIYVVNAVGAPTRSDDANTAGDLAAAFLFVEEGTHAGEGWVTTFTSSDVLGASNVDWVLFSIAGALTASNGITRVGNDFQLNITGLVNTAIVGGDELVFNDASASGTHIKRSVTSFLSDFSILTATDIPASEQAELAAIDTLGNGMVAKTANATYAARTISANGAGALAGISITNGTGISGNPTIGLSIQNLAARSDAVDVADRVAVYNVTSGANEYYTVSEIAGAAAPSFSTWAATGNTTGDVSVVADSSADTVNIGGGDGISVNFTAVSDTVLIGLSRSGLADTAVTTADTVPFFDATASNAPEYRSFANIISDLSILTATDIPASEQAELAALDALGNGMVAKTANATYAARTLTAGASGGIGITNGTGVSGNPTIALDITGLTADATLENTDEFPYFNGTGNRKVTWAAIKSEIQAETPGIQVLIVNVTENQASPIAVGTLPANSRVLRCRVDVDTAWTNAGQTLDVGIQGGAADALMTDLENNLDAAAIYETDVDFQTAVAANVQATLSTGGAGTGAAQVVVEYVTATTI